MRITERFGATSRGCSFSIYVPSKDRHGRPVDDQHWMDAAMHLLTKLFGRCTAMPRLEGIWANEGGQTLQETTNIVFSYVQQEQLDQNAERIRDFLLEMGKATSQAEIGFGYGGQFYTIKL